MDHKLTINFHAKSLVQHFAQYHAQHSRTTTVQTNERNVRKPSWWKKSSFFKETCKIITWEIQTQQVNFEDQFKNTKKLPRLNQPSLTTKWRKLSYLWKRWCRLFGLNAGLINHKIELHKISFAQRFNSRWIYPLRSIVLLEHRKFLQVYWLWWFSWARSWHWSWHWSRFWYWLLLKP